MGLGVEQDREVPAQQHGGDMAMVVLDVLAVGGENPALQTIGAVPALCCVGFVTIEHQRHQAVPRRRQSLVALEVGVEIQQGFADRLGIHLGSDSAERVGTGQSIA